MNPIDKIHHISAIVGDPQENLQFYRDVLGLRLVKQTVNFDDEHTYHLYYSNQSVDNGTILTFFPWSNAHKGRVGSGQVGTIAFRIPKGTTAYWKEHLAKHQISVKETELFNQPTLELQDSHDLSLALVEGVETADSAAILGFHGTVLLSADPEATSNTLVNDLGLESAVTTEKSYSFYTKGTQKHQIIVPKTVMKFGRWGVGTVHHIAWSVPTYESQKQWQDYLYTHHYSVTEIKDRNYFKAIYFQEHGDIIFEIATETPGFTVDESFENLGKQLMLPPQFEARRAEIISRLPRLDV
ncbi:MULTISPECIES: VOC family protein [unclassified Enterococcus]|uniref:VOC family protein n=1 Tax=unclassified Enterococcus TaxID=2608891 RepID=UPI001CE0E054|nr:MULTISPECIES: VOC family protein [unclassified Enterococcus]MCA5013037.1 VOC family protein [Enterococcus sp. S23]MCA5016287.1 VOC family protein [Enterococcus sp. S22(2020)]